MRSSLPGSAIPGELKRGESVLGRCVIERRVWRDRLAAVYLARGREPGEVFSVWAVHSAAIARSERAAHVFGLEMERLTLLEHPGIPQVIAFDAADSGPVVISVRRPGSTLREVIASGTDRSPRLAARVLQGLARILEALHGQSPPVLHRGIIPERVVLDEEGELHLDECGYLDALVTAGFVTDRTVLATAQPGYLVPEELAFPPTPALDVFSVAVLLFELLTGKLPFGEVGPPEFAQALRREHLPTVSQHRGDLLSGVDAVFERAFGVARGEGYTTVQAFARDLLRSLDPDSSTRLTLPGSEADLAEAAGASLAVPFDPEPTPSNGDYSAMLAQLDARRSGAEPKPEARELAPDAEAVTPRVPVMSIPRRVSELPSPEAPVAASKRTLPGGSFALPPATAARLAAQPLGASAPRAAPRAAPPSNGDASVVDLSDELDADALAIHEIPSEALSTFDGEAIDLSVRDLQSLVSNVREPSGPVPVALLADQPTQVAPAPRALARVSLTPPSGRPLLRPTPTPRAPSSAPPARPSGPAPRARSSAPARPTPTPRAPSSSPPARSSLPGSAPPRQSVPTDAPARLPAPARVPSDLVRPTSSMPPDASQLFAQSARLLAVSTVIAAVCVTTGLLYIARASDELAAALRASAAADPAPPRALVIPSPTPPVVDAGPPAAVVTAPPTPMDAGVALAAAPDAGPVAVATPTPPPDAGSPAAAAVARPPAATVPGPATIFRLVSALRAPVADCVEGVEARSVTLVPRFDGATGTVVHLRLRGIFSEPPMAPCLDEAVRRVRVAPFAAPTWEPTLTFPIAAPRWVPNPNQGQ